MMIDGMHYGPNCNCKGCEDGHKIKKDEDSTSGYIPNKDIVSGGYIFPEATSPNRIEPSPDIYTAGEETFFMKLKWKSNAGEKGLISRHITQRELEEILKVLNR